MVLFGTVAACVNLTCAAAGVWSH